MFDILNNMPHSQFVTDTRNFIFICKPKADLGYIGYSYSDNTKNLRNLLKIGIDRLNQDYFIKKIHVFISDRKVIENLGFKIEEEFNILKIKTNRIHSKTYPGYTVRNAKDSDLKRLWDLYREEISLGIHSKRDLKLWLKYNKKGFFVCEIEKSIAGAVFAHIGFEGSKQSGWLRAVTVAKRYRKKYIGTNMIIHGLNYLKSKNVENITAVVLKTNTPSLKLFEKCGFYIDGELFKFKKVL